MSVLSISRWSDLRALWEAESARPDYTYLRPPETGLVMVRGRMGGTGAPFNAGEATVTRCSIKLANETCGHAYVMGRNGSHAETAAVCDALLQDRETHSQLMERIITPLARLLEDRDAKQAAEAAATKVDFFTMVRGED